MKKMEHILFMGINRKIVNIRFILKNDKYSNRSDRGNI